MFDFKGDRKDTGKKITGGFYREGKKCFIVVKDLTGFTVDPIRVVPATVEILVDRVWLSVTQIEERIRLCRYCRYWDTELLDKKGPCYTCTHIKINDLPYKDNWKPGKGQKEK